MCLAARSGIGGYRRPSTKLTGCSHGEDIWLGLVVLQDVFFANVGGGKDRNKWRRSRGFLHAGASIRLFALDEAHHADDIEPEFPGSFDGLDCGSTGRAHVIHDHDSRALFAESLDPLSGAVLFLGFAYEESAQVSAQHGNGYNDGISAHRQAADSLCFPAALADFLQENLSRKTRAFRIERRSAAVDVVVARSTGRKLEFSETEGPVRQGREQMLTSGMHENLRYHGNRAVRGGVKDRSAYCTLHPLMEFASIMDSVQSSGLYLVSMSCARDRP